MSITKQVSSFIYAHTRIRVFSLKLILYLYCNTPKSFLLTHKKLISMLHSQWWQSDASATVCTGCMCKFSWLTRRHHCRHCGLVFCANCSSHRLWLLPFEPPSTSDAATTLDDSTSSTVTSASVARHFVTATASASAHPRWSSDSMCRNVSPGSSSSHALSYITPTLDEASDVIAGAPSQSRTCRSASGLPRFMSPLMLPITAAKASAEHDTVYEGGERTSSGVTDHTMDTLTTSSHSLPPAPTRRTPHPTLVHHSEEWCACELPHTVATPTRGGLTGHTCLRPLLCSPSHTDTNQTAPPMKMNAAMHTTCWEETRHSAHAVPSRPWQRACGLSRAADTRHWSRMMRAAPHRVHRGQRYMLCRVCRTCWARLTEDGAATADASASLSLGTASCASSSPSASPHATSACATVQCVRETVSQDAPAHGWDNRRDSALRRPALTGPIDVEYAELMALAHRPRRLCVVVIDERQPAPLGGLYGKVKCTCEACGDEGVAEEACASAPPAVRPTWHDLMNQSSQTHRRSLTRTTTMTDTTATSLSATDVLGTHYYDCNNSSNNNNNYYYKIGERVESVHSRSDGPHAATLCRDACVRDADALFAATLPVCLAHARTASSSRCLVEAVRQTIQRASVREQHDACGRAGVRVDTHSYVHSDPTRESRHRRTLLSLLLPVRVKTARHSTTTSSSATSTTRRQTTRLTLIFPSTTREPLSSRASSYSSSPSARSRHVSRKGRRRDTCTRGRYRAGDTATKKDPHHPQPHVRTDAHATGQNEAQAASPTRGNDTPEELFRWQPARTAAWAIWHYLSSSAHSLLLSRSRQQTTRQDRSGSEDIASRAAPTPCAQVAQEVAVTPALAPTATCVTSASCPSRRVDRGGRGDVQASVELCVLVSRRPTGLPAALDSRCLSSSDCAESAAGVILSASSSASMVSRACVGVSGRDGPCPAAAAAAAAASGHSPVCSVSLSYASMLRQRQRRVSSSPLCPPSPHGPA